MDLHKSLETIERGIEGVQASQKSLEEKAVAAEQEREQILTTIKGHDERLTSGEETLQALEKAVEKARFGTGVGLSEPDSLRNALPERVRNWIGPVQASRGYQAIARSAGPNTPLSDPVIVTASLAWMQARINAVLQIQRGNPERARAWNDEAESIESVLQKLAPPNLRVKADLQEDIAAEGGNLVPTVTEAVIGWLVKEASIVRQAGPTVVTMTTKTHNLPTLANDFSVSWTAEEGTITDAAPASPFGSGTLTAKKQTGLVTVSNELLQDNIVNLMDFVMTHLTQQIGRAEDTQALEGDGTTFTGLFAASGVNAVAGGANALSFDEIVKLIYGGEHQSTIDGGVIFAHPWIMRDALQLTTGATGTPWLVMPSVNAQGGPAQPRNLLGVPFFPTSVISRVRGGGDETTAYHGNPRYMIIGDRLGTNFLVNPYGGKLTEGTPNISSFEKDQVVLRLTRRVGILIWVPAYFTKLTAVAVAA